MNWGPVLISGFAMVAPLWRSSKLCRPGMPVATQACHGHGRRISLRIHQLALL